jgi:SAM-dependent methyltransferase
MVDIRTLYDRKEPLSNRQAALRLRTLHSYDHWLDALVNPRDDDRLLDVGCGIGSHLARWTPRVANAVGIEPSVELHRAAQQALSGLRTFDGHTPETLLGKAEEVVPTLARRGFTVAVASYSIYYMDAEAVIESLDAALAPSARLVLVGSPDENDRQLLEFHTAAGGVVPPSYAPGFSDVRKYAGVVAPRFAEVLTQRLENPAVFESASDFLEYYYATSLFVESEKLTPGLRENAAQVATGQEFPFWLRKLVDALVAVRW